MNTLPSVTGRPGPASALRHVLAHRPYTLLGCAFLLGLACLFCLRQESEWDDVFIHAARNLWSGQGVYGHGDGFAYPPFAALFATPLLPFTGLAARLAWFAANALALVILVPGAWYLTGGKRIDGESVPVREHAVFWIGLGCALPYLLNCLAHQQVDIVLAAIIVASCLALSRSRPMLAATGFGVAAAVKCTPLLFAPYLIWRGQWRAGLWLMAVAVGLNLLPNFTCPGGDSWYLQEYVQGFLKPLTNADYPPGMWASLLVYNQSLAGAANRWLLDNPWWDVSLATAKLAVKLIDAVFVLAAACCLRWPLRQPRGGDTGSPSRGVVEYGVVLCLMLLLSPMSSPAHFGILLLPGLALARRGLAGQAPGLALTALLAAALGLLPNKDLVGRFVCDWALWLGAPMWSTVLLLVGSLWALAARDAQTVLPANQERPGLPRAA